MGVEINIYKLEKAREEFETLIKDDEQFKNIWSDENEEYEEQDFKEWFEAHHENLKQNGFKADNKQQVIKDYIKEV